MTKPIDVAIDSVVTEAQTLLDELAGTVAAMGDLLKQLVKEREEDARP